MNASYANRPIASRRKPGAFTLLELLVVVAIISMLFSILVPSMARAKAIAREVQCMANQRVCGMALHYYATDHKGRLPSSETWVYDILEDIGDYQPANALQSSRETLPPALFCPCDPDPFPMPYMTGSMAVTSWMVNGAATDFAMGGGRKVGLGLFGGEGHLEQVDKASRCMMLGETSNYGKVVDLDHPAAQEAFTAAGASASDARARFHHRMTSGFYHSGKMAIFYLDGHSEMLAGRAVDPLPPSQWPGGSLMDAGVSFFPSLSLPSASSDPYFWGPPYVDWWEDHRD